MFVPKQMPKPPTDLSPDPLHKNFENKEKEKRIEIMKKYTKLKRNREHSVSS
jgi:hypothetical protein